MLSFYLQKPSTATLIPLVQEALDYERGMQHAIEVERWEFTPAPFLPAAKVAYERILCILSKPVLSGSDLDAIHAEMMGVYEQPHYPGVGLFFTSEAVDEWLAEVDPHSPRPSLAEVHRVQGNQRAARRLAEFRAAQADKERGGT